MTVRINVSARLVSALGLRKVNPLAMCSIVKKWLTILITVLSQIYNETAISSGLAA